MVRSRLVSGQDWPKSRKTTFSPVSQAARFKVQGGSDATAAFQNLEAGRAKGRVTFRTHVMVNN